VAEKDSGAAPVEVTAYRTSGVVGVYVIVAIVTGASTSELFRVRAAANASAGVPAGAFPVRERFFPFTVMRVIDALGLVPGSGGLLWQPIANTLNTSIMLSKQQIKRVFFFIVNSSILFDFVDYGNSIH
jgi:hypothetical protein